MAGAPGTLFLGTVIHTVNCIRLKRRPSSVCLCVLRKRLTLDVKVDRTVIGINLIIVSGIHHSIPAFDDTGTLGKRLQDRELGDCETWDAAQLSKTPFLARPCFQGRPKSLLRGAASLESVRLCKPIDRGGDASGNRLTRLCFNGDCGFDRRSKRAGKHGIEPVVGDAR
jgi:hypothetical protein